MSKASIDNLRKITFGTRASALAVAQSRLFADALQAIYPDLKIEMKTIVTSGDRIQDRPLDREGGKGLFVKEIEAALLDQEIDFAVHSLKDLPAVLPATLSLSCFPQRLSSADVLISREGTSLASLPLHAKIGTTSLRRRVQLKRLRPDLNFALLRGNIDTRLKRLEKGDFDAIVLAKAGLLRLGISLDHAQELPIIPAPGQGSLDIEIRKDDEALHQLLSPLHHPETAILSEAERRVMKKLEGDCNVPFGVFGAIKDNQLKLTAFLSDPEGLDWIAESLSGPQEQFLELADRLGETMWRQGAEAIIRKNRETKINS